MGQMHRVLARIGIGAGVLALAVSAFAGSARAANDPSAAAFLAGALKPAMQKTLKAKVPGLVVTKVTCYVPSTSADIKGKCTAKFQVTKFRLLGVYQAKAALSGRGKLTWSTTSVACTDSKTHKKIPC
jgi:hypothetical protein